MLFCCYKRETRIVFEKINSLELVCIVSELSTVFYEKQLNIAGGHICTICLSGFKEGQPTTVISHCRHAFHPDCLNTWIKSEIGRRRCPTCNVDIPEDSKTKYQEF